MTPTLVVFWQKAIRDIPIGRIASGNGNHGWYKYNPYISVGMHCNASWNMHNGRVHITLHAECENVHNVHVQCVNREESECSVKAMHWLRKRGLTCLLSSPSAYEAWEPVTGDLDRLRISLHTIEGIGWFRMYIRFPAVMISTIFSNWYAYSYLQIPVSCVGIICLILWHSIEGFETWTRCSILPIHWKTPMTSIFFAVSFEKTLVTHEHSSESWNLESIFFGW